MIEIKNRYTGNIIRQVPNDTLRNIDLSNADLTDANLFGANLSGANLSNAILRNVNLSDANLFGAKLSDGDLSGAILCRTDLSGAILSGASLTDADLSNAKIQSAKLGDNIIRVYNFHEYDCYRLNNTFRAGCQIHTIEQWKNFTDKEILKMDGRKALKFYHDILLKIIDL